MLLVKLLISSRLLVVKLQRGAVSVICGFCVWWWSVPKIPALLKCQLYINSLTLGMKGNRNTHSCWKDTYGKECCCPKVEHPCKFLPVDRINPFSRTGEITGYWMSWLLDICVSFQWIAYSYLCPFLLFMSFFLICRSSLYMLNISPLLNDLQSISVDL